MKKLIFLASALSLLLMVGACGNKSTATADAVDSTAILDSIHRADSIQKADSQTVVDYLGQLYDLVLNNKGNYNELTSHFADNVKKRLVEANEFDDGSMALYELRTGEQDGPSNVSKVTGIAQEDGWYVVSYTDMGTPGSTKLKVEVSDGKAVVTDYARVESQASAASTKASGKVDEVEQAVRDFEEFYRTNANLIKSGQLDPMGGTVSEEVRHVYAFEEQWTPAQRKRVEKIENQLY